MNNIVVPIKENVNLELFYKYEKELSLVFLPHNKERYWHSISVALTAVNLAEIYNVDKDTAFVAGMLHDYCKSLDLEKEVEECDRRGIKLTEEDRKATGCVHGFLGAYVCKEKFSISDDIFNAIYYHTCGRPGMTMLEKIIYIADFIEPLRRFRDKVQDIRKLAFTDIDKAIVKACELNIEFLIYRKKFIHSNTNKTMEYYKNL